MQHGQVAADSGRAILPLALERDKNTTSGGVGCRRGANRASRHDFRGQAAAYAAEIVAVEKIGARILAQRQDEAGTRRCR